MEGGFHTVRGRDHDWKAACPRLFWSSVPRSTHPNKGAVFLMQRKSCTKVALEMYACCLGLSDGYLVDLLLEP